jgi:His-Xaa-Ser system protein HxsD
MKSLEYEIKKRDQIVFRVNRRIYSEEMICKMMYRVNRQYEGNLLGTRFHTISFEMKRSEDNSKIPLQEQAKEISNALLHEKMRSMIYQETKDLREMIMARALYSASVPVKDSIEPNSLQGEENNDEIFSDWFELNEK